MYTDHSANGDRPRRFDSLPWVNKSQFKYQICLYNLKTEIGNVVNDRDNTIKLHRHIM